MKKTLLLFVVFLFLSAGSSLARPPSEILLTYDPETKVLHIDVAHVSHNSRSHFIRRITVSLNDQPPTEFDYVNQTSPSHILQDVTLDAKPGDRVMVQAICNKAGRKEVSLIIPDAAPVR